MTWGEGVGSLTEPMLARYVSEAWLLDTTASQCRADFDGYTIGPPPPVGDYSQSQSVEGGGSEPAEEEAEAEAEVAEAEAGLTAEAKAEAALTAACR